MESTVLSGKANTAVTEYRDIRTITSEIHFYKRQAGTSILEIGNRLIEAKEQLDHGQWLCWLRDEVDFSDVTAQRLMRLAREYPNPSPVTDLGAAKALTLLAIPAPAREAFVKETHLIDGEEKTVADMSKRELEKAVRERAEALRQKAEAEDAAEEARRVAEKHAAALAEADRRALDAKTEADRLQNEKTALTEELERLRNSAPPEPPGPVEPDQQLVAALRKEAAKIAKKEAEEKLRKKIEDADRAKAAADKKISDAQAERERIQQEAEQEKKDAAAKVAALEKRLAAASSETVTVFKTHFENIQGPINAMLSCVMKLKDESDTRNKLSAALRALCEKTISALPN